MDNRTQQEFLFKDDFGLTKKGLQEVHVITGKVKEDLNRSIDKLKKDFDQRLDRMEAYQNKKWEEMGTFRKTMYDTLDKIDKAVVGLEFKHSWKTAMWVFVGSAVPTTIGVIFFILKS